MKQIIALTDYQDQFGSKFNAVPYSSGMDKKLLSTYFSNFHVEIIYISFSDVISYPDSFWKNRIVIYTSIEDNGYLYKSFIEDIVYYLEIIGAQVVPSYKYLKANNNKVFMELLRVSFGNDQLKNISSKVFGSVEEVEKNASSLRYPLVYKPAAGAMSKGVGIAYNQKELVRNLKKIARSKQYLKEYWERGRAIKHTGYNQQSRYRSKFVLQNFVENLAGDYKVLVFGDKYYILKREAKAGDFRASGSGIRNYVKVLPEGILEYANLCKSVLNVPNASLDIAFNGKSFYLIEYQCLFFGSYTLTYSEFYWHRLQNNSFALTEGKSILEEEYAKSIVDYVFQDKR